MITKRFKENDGQVTLINLIAVLVTLFVYTIIAPILIDDFINDFVADQLAHPNQMTPAIVVLIEITPFCILLMIILTGFSYAIPHQEQQRFGQ